MRVVQIFWNAKQFDTRNQITFEGNLAYKLIWIDFDPELRTQLKHMGVITMVGNNTYYIEFTAESSNYDRYLPVIDRMISTISGNYQAEMKQVKIEGVQTRLDL